MNKHKNILELEEKFIGHLISYEGREFLLLTYKQEKEKITLVTDDAKWIHTNVFDLGVMLEHFTVIKTSDLQKVDKKISAAPTFFAVKNEAIEKTQNALLSLLDELDTGKIKQAKINATVNIAEAVIKTEKLKIEMVSSMNSLTKTMYQ